MAFKACVEDWTCRWAAVCSACDYAPDSTDGPADLVGRIYDITGISGRVRATCYDDKNYRRWLRRDAARAAVRALIALLLGGRHWSKSPGRTFTN
jgi:hypothetical protein